jgi:CHAD domain-containing protein
MTPARRTRAPLANPRASIGAVFPELARALVADARKHGSEVLTSEEGVHQLRVALRKLRTVLRAFRGVYGRFWVEGIREGLRAAADAAGGVRDEEVFLGRVREVELFGRDAMNRDRWLARREKALARDRSLLARQLEAGLLEEPLQRLEALFVLPLVPGRDQEAGLFAAEASAAAESTVAQRLEVARAAYLAHAAVPTPEAHHALGVALHDLRIGYKRVRYTNELFAKVLPLAAAARAKEAKKLQGWLGDVHDVDVARPKLAGATTCPAVVRRAILNELEALSAERLAKLVALYGWGATPADTAAAAAASIEV